MDCEKDIGPIQNCLDISKLIMIFHKMVGESKCNDPIVLEKISNLLKKAAQAKQVRDREEWLEGLYDILNQLQDFLRDTNN